MSIRVLDSQGGNQSRALESQTPGGWRSRPWDAQQLIEPTSIAITWSQATSLLGHAHAAVTRMGHVLEAPCERQICEQRHTSSDPHRSSTARSQ